jgi:uncharacterized protein (DUF1810 family)
MTARVTERDPNNLQRFVDAQHGTFRNALAELERGRKETHWMWFVFPQLRGLGSSSTAVFYSIASLDEALCYMSHPLLGPRLREALGAIMAWAGRRSAEQILGAIDAMKLRSSLTLFEQAEPAVFAPALDAFFGGERDERTLALLNAWR